jgi:hypothetical protein
MENLKLLIIVFILFAFNMSASSMDPVNPIKATEQLRAEIIEIIGNRCPYDYDKKECRASIFFTVNSNNEIVIVKVLSKNKMAEPFYQEKLNSKKVSRPPYEVDQLFYLPIRIIKRS